MGVIKKIRDRIFNGTDWDTVHYETSADMVISNDGTNLEEKFKNFGKIIDFPSYSASLINIGGNVWMVKAGLATGTANSSTGVIWTYNIPAAFKCKRVIGKADAVSTTDGLESLTNGYCVDYTPSNSTTQIVGGCYGMKVGVATRIRLTFFIVSDL